MKTTLLPNSDILRTMASGENQNPAAVKAIRDSINQIGTSIASLLDYLEEPLKSKFLEVKSEINTMLAGLPETDKVPAALASNDVLQRLLGVMTVAQSMMTNLTEAAKDAQGKLASTRASMSTEIETAITAKVTAGELVRKSDVDLKVGNAISEARTLFATEQKTIVDRRTALASLSIPAPGDDKLGGKDEEFNARRDAAKARVDALKEFKVPADRLVALCWDVDQSSFDVTVTVLKENKPAAKANGFLGATKPGVPDTKTSIMF